MRNNRKDIDNFLIELNLFMRKNIRLLTEDNIFDLIFPLKTGVPSTLAPKDEIMLQSLVMYINTKGQRKIKAKRTSKYVRRVAYKLEYQIVKWESYEEIFAKLIWNKDFVWLKLKDFYLNNSAKEFIIPKDYWKISNDKYYNGEYIII